MKQTQYPTFEDVRVKAQEFQKEIANYVELEVGNEELAERIRDVNFANLDTEPDRVRSRDLLDKIYEEKSSRRSTRGSLYHLC